MNRGFYLGTIFGIPIRADISVFILVAFILFFWSDLPLILRYCVALGLLFSIVWHELAHSLTAMAFGGKVRNITLQLMGGCAYISEMPRKAWQEWLMALAGPLSSFVLLGLFYVASKYVPGGEVVKIRQPNGAIAVALRGSLLQPMFENLAAINFMLGFFNLLPAFPMDGGRILRSTLQGVMSKVRATWIATRIGRAIAVVFIISGILNLVMETMDKEIRIPSTNYFALDLLIILLTRGSFIKILIGFSVFQAAQMEYRMVLAEEANDRQTRGFGGGGFNPFQSRGSGWGPPPPPPDDDSAFISPPPYRKDKPDRIDIKKRGD